MWKLTCLLTAAFSAAFVSGSQGRFVSSPFQPAIPFGTAIKMTPDPSSIWSWHHDVTATGRLSIPVEIDIDGNGQPDTMNPAVRVLVSGIQVFVDRESSSEPGKISLADAQGDLWEATPTLYGDSTGTGSASQHLTTPIVVSPGASLRLMVEANSITAYKIRVHLVGRVVNL